MIGAALARGVRRALREGTLAAWLAVPSVAALPLLAAPVYLALSAGLPADRDVLAGLDGGAAVDLFDRAWPRHGEALAVAAAVAAGVWAAGGFLLQAAGARALARSRRRVGSARLLGTLGAGVAPLAALLAVAAALHVAAYGVFRAIDGLLELVGKGVGTDVAADAVCVVRLAAAALVLLAVRCWCRLAMAVAAHDPARSAPAAFGRAVALALTRPAIPAVDLAAAGAGLAAAALAAVPRWLLPQGGWATVLLGLVLGVAPVLVRAACRTAGIAATLAVLAAADERAAARAGAGRPSRAG